ncbi:MAG: NAD-dependent epimerase/dehydratase family protein [Oscillospiraceae bacterium]|jgi:nucleoside-diphosphate-sugar epimerase|nr:NAD-dependent epimerase/dehydratase family protein [Oscillospiraceae bacterium]
MQKRVLVIGGSLFTGRVFNILASRTGDYELHVVNRGHYPLNIETATEYKCDRRAARLLSRMIPDDIVFDAVVDFCAYNAGDVAPLISAFSGRIKHYICFSTASLYDPRISRPKTETDPLVNLDGAGQVDDYLRGKLAVERELIDSCANHGIPYTILRPTFIYGPLNYAPRESYFIELIARKHTVPVPMDATASWNFVYVKDIANALMLMLGDARAHNQIFNLAASEQLNYTRLMGEFERLNGGSFDTREVTVDEIETERIPLPFPLTDDDLTSGEKFAKTFDFEYTPFPDGMENTFKSFYSLYVS